MASNNINVNVKTNASMATESVHDLSNSFVSLKRDGKRANDSLSGVAHSLLNVKNVIAGVGLYRLARAFSTASESAMDMIESVHLYNVAMGDMAVETSKSLEVLSELTGLDNTKILDTVGSYNLLARSMGVTADNAVVLSTNTNKLALDLSSLTNRSIVKVQEDLRSGLIGQSKTMYKYGIDVTEAAIKQEALNLGIAKSVRHMSQAEKMQLRYNVMIRQSALAHGDFAETINRPANQLRILSERFVTLARTIGSIFIPMMEKILPYLNLMLMLLTRVAGAIASLVGYKPPKIENTDRGGFVGGLEEEADDATKAVGGTGKAVKKLQNQLMGFDEINLYKEPTEPSGGGGGGGAGSGFDMGDIDFDLMGYDNLLDGLKQKSDELFDSLVDGFKRVSDVAMADWGIGEMIKGIQEGIELVNFDWIGINMKSAMVTASEIAKQSLLGMQPAFQSAGEMMGKYFKYGIAIMGNIMDPMAEALSDFLIINKDRIINWSNGISKTIARSFDNIGDVFESIGDIILDKVISSKDDIYDVFYDLLGNITGTVGLIGTVVSDIFESYTFNIKSFVSTNIETITSVVNRTIDIFLGMGDLINKIWSDIIDKLLIAWDDWGKDLVDGTFGIFADIGGVILGIYDDVILPIWESGLELLDELWTDTFSDLVDEVLEFASKVGEFILALWDNVLLPFVRFIVEGYGPPIVDIFNGLKPVIKTVVEFIGNHITGLLEILGGLLEFLTGVFSGDWKKAWEGIKTIFDGIVNKIIIGTAKILGKALVDFYLWLEGLFMSIIEWGREILIKIMDFMGDLLLKLVEKMIEIDESMTQAVKDMIGAVVGFFAELPGKIGEKLDEFKDTIRQWRDNAIRWSKQYVPDIINDIVGWFAGLPRSLFTVGVNMIKDLWNGILSVGTWLQNKLADYFGKIWPVVKKVVGVVGGGTPAKTASIPALADGGMVNSGQLFLANEDGPEMVGKFGGRTGVVNNDQIVSAITEGVYSAVTSAMAVTQQTTGSGSDEVVINLDGREMGRALLPNINSEVRRLGYKPILRY